MVDWLVHHPTYRVLICRVHGYAISNLLAHLRDQHSELQRQARKAIVSEYAGLEYGPLPNADFCYGPATPIPAIDGLTVHNGFACGACKFLTPSWKWFRVHWNKAHKGSVVAEGKQWSKARLQTFFTNPKPAVHYFCVTAPEQGVEAAAEAANIAAADRSGQSQRQLIDDIKEQWAYEEKQQEELLKILADGANKHETTNWLKRSGWTAHIKERDLGEIYACGRMPAKSEHELRRLCAAMDRLFFDRCIGGLKRMPLMTRLLLASPHPQDAHSRPFGPLQEKTSMDRYLIYWKRFLCYCLTVLPLDQPTLRETHGVCFSSAQRESLAQLQEHLADAEWPEEALEEELLQISASFWMQQLEGYSFASPLWHFVGVLRSGSRCRIWLSGSPGSGIRGYARPPTLPWAMCSACCYTAAVAIK